MMKRNLNICVLPLLLFCFSCSSDNGDQKTLEDFSLRFVYLDGTALEQGACVDPNGQYALAIEGYKMSYLDEVKYTINSVVYTINFTEDGTHIIPIHLEPGQNTAKLLDANVSATLHFSIQGGFEEVN
ncbi:hypothetical protein L0P88_20020 [Muricauda sp. SCSIO 64092]|uniref:hypothetical protein n=1 Tax=Allomuricauda sp. SCSIO 64092 TaxID=2908842 RepID=UPI001FF3F9BB|nr:hypothetical protein [Muricauda sp. SCSIO 64092]UOY06199.1 hypothetical protein L0P88_20020 [Muricauda sp. SCSIO 64092]